MSDRARMLTLMERAEADAKASAEWRRVIDEMKPMLGGYVPSRPAEILWCSGWNEGWSRQR